ncbi:MAG: SMC-Scp complex subunit ScpB [Candidatus Thermoplasmatota archaeon]
MKTERIIEVALFSAGRALGIDEIEATTSIKKNEVRKAIENLIEYYSSADIGIEVAKVGEKYAMQVKKELLPYAAKFAPMEIGLQTLKTLVLIAYHQPIKQSELQNMIGDKVYLHVKQLLDFGLISAKKFGRTKILSTTNRFSEYFGIETTDKKRIKEWIEKAVR